MGANIVRRLMRDGHGCVVFDVNEGPVKQLAKEGALGAMSVADLIEKLSPPRVVWVMVPAGEVTEKTIEDLANHLERGDIIIDGGNSYYRDDMTRAATLFSQGVHLIDCGTSGGVWGIERGYCLMIGGETDVVRHLEPIFASLRWVQGTASGAGEQVGAAGQTKEELIRVIITSASGVHVGPLAEFALFGLLALTKTCPSLG